MLLERVFLVKTNGIFHTPYKPAISAFDDLLGDFKTQCRKLIVPAAPMTPIEFGESYEGRKRELYIKAAISLQSSPVKRSDSYLSSFMKVEKYNFTLKKDPVPRVIQPRSPRYNVEVGKYIRPIEKRLYKVINTIFEATTICKGLNAVDRGHVISEKWHGFTDPVAVGIDAARFDQHVSETALKFEHSIYQMFYPGCKELAMLLRWQLRNRGYVRQHDCNIKYKVDGNRMSGDMNTALGNCLLMSAMFYSFAKSVNIKYPSFVNDGDDGVIFIERKELYKLDTMPAYFKDLGFKLEVEEPVYELEKVVFCQSQPVNLGDGTYLMVRDPRAALAKDCLSIKPLDNKIVMEKWCAAVGMGGLSLTGAIPIWQDFYSSIYRSANGAKPLTDPTLETGLARLSKGMSRKFSPVTEITRYSFYLAFDIFPAEQLAIEQYYRLVNVEYVSQEHIQREVLLPGL
jgi:hypothetical protein